jgi:hypothetical protein
MSAEDRFVILPCLSIRTRLLGMLIERPREVRQEQVAIARASGDFHAGIDDEEVLAMLNAAFRSTAAGQIPEAQRIRAWWTAEILPLLAEIEKGRLGGPPSGDRES